MLVVVSKTDFQLVSCGRIGKRMTNCILLILCINIYQYIVVRITDFEGPNHIPLRVYHSLFMEWAAMDT